MFSLTFFRVTFTCSWRMFLFTGCAVLLFARLGHWQIMRAHEKQHMLSLAQEEASRVPLAWQAGRKRPKAYQSLNLKGRYLPDVLLLDNQHYEHQFGYDVLSPLRLSDGSVVLVDRGWIQADPMRIQLPEVKVPGGIQSVRGYAYYPSNKHWLLGQAFEKKANNMMVVELIDTPMISKILHKSVYPFIIRLHPGTANAYVCEWPIVSMPPSRHVAYAIQWYAMALLVMALFIGLNVKKTK